MEDEWPIDEVFDDDYLSFYLPLMPEELSDAQSTTIWSLLALAEGQRVLDLACGHGRIANRLAARGATVTGLDATPMFLALAREDAGRRGVDVDYVLGDMRELAWVDHFDAVVSWFAAFGYFDDEQNRLVLSRVFTSLRTGGRFLIELNHKDALMSRWTPSSVTRLADAMMIDERTYDPLTGRSNCERTMVRDGKVRQTSYFTRMFSFTELRDWLLQAGFASVQGFAVDGTTLTASSMRMILVAVK